MAEESTNPDREPRFSTRDFVSRNSSLFTALGVFGAISVYFTQLEISSRWGRLGLVSSLSIFILIAATIYVNIAPESSDKEPFDYLIKPQKDRFKLALFLVPFFGVTSAIVAIVTAYSDTVGFLLLFVSFIIGMSSVVRLVNLLETPESWDLSVGESPEVVLFLGFIARNATYSLIVGSGILCIGLLNQWIILDELLLFRTELSPTTLLVGYSSGLVSGGLLYLSIAVMILFSHAMVLGLKRKGDFEDVANLYQDLFGGPTDENK